MSVSLNHDRILRAIEDDTNTGFCLSCGAAQDGVEPDARRYPCERCGAHAVYGAEELLFGRTDQ